jgi:hypothetical protein
MNKCPECKKETKGKFCSRSCQNLYYWKKPDYREKMSLMSKKTWKDPETRSILMKSRKKTAINRWKDKNQRIQHSETRKAYCNSEIGKIQITNSSIKRSIEKDRKSVV